MPEQMGRSGKKPKYQIADIGGAELTPQDISTERVLNFLIRGESTSAPDQTPVTPVPDLIDPNAGSSAADTAQSLPDESRPSSSLPPSVPGGRRGLAHFFERASRGEAVAGKDSTSDLDAREQPSTSASVVEVEHVAVTRPDPLRQTPEVAVELILPPSETTSAIRPTIANKTRPRIPPPVKIQENTVSAAPVEKLPLTAIHASSDDSLLVSLWKTHYRLNDGEIQTLRTLYRMSREQGSAECYVKMHLLAESSGLTYRYCQKVVRSLGNLGWITKLKDYDPTDQRGVLYRVNSNPALAPIL